MKALIESIIVFVGAVAILAAAEPQELPDLQKAFQTEKLEVVHKEGAIGWYLFETNLEFVVLKEGLLKFLGNDWSIIEHDKDAEARFRVGVENQGGANLLDMAVIRDGRRPNKTVSLHLTERLSNDGTKTRFASVLRSDSAKEGVREITLSKLTRSAAEAGNAWAQRELGFE